MSMDHKAYAFDWSAFERGLKPILIKALETDEPGPLVAFIKKNRQRLMDPAEGEPLDEDWQDQINLEDVQELGDYALTLYYRPDECYGVGGAWMDLDDEVPAPVRQALKGEPMGPQEARFDPGRMGCYFQTPKQVKESLASVKKASRSELDYFQSLLERCVRDKSGLYVTF